MKKKLKIDKEKLKEEQRKMKEKLKEDQKKMKEKARGSVSDYKKFALKGNALDLAIGMVIGAAFTAIVNAIVSCVITPVISLLTNKIDISSLFVSLDGKDYASIDAAKEAGAAIITYGELINSVINFLIISTILFIITKYISRAKSRLEALDKEKAEEEKATTKVCPYCKSEINIEATRCAHCTSMLDETK